MKELVLQLTASNSVSTVAPESIRVPMSAFLLGAIKKLERASAAIGEQPPGNVSLSFDFARPTFADPDDADELNLSGRCEIVLSRRALCFHISEDQDPNEWAEAGDIPPQALRDLVRGVLKLESQLPESRAAAEQKLIDAFNEARVLANGTVANMVAALEGDFEAQDGRLVQVHVRPVVDGLDDKEDAAAMGVHLIRITDPTVPDDRVSDAALDVLHRKLAIGTLDDFEIWVEDLAGNELSVGDDHDGGSLERHGEYLEAFPIDRPDPERLREQYGEHAQHAFYSRFDWASAGLNGETQRGYWEWVASNIEQCIDSCERVRQSLTEQQPEAAPNPQMG